MTPLAIALGSLAICIGIFWNHARRYAADRQNKWSFLFGHRAPAAANKHEDEKEPAQEEPEDLDHTEINRAYRIGEMHFARGEWEEAEKHYIRVLSMHDAHPEAMNRLGVIYIQQGNPRRAEIMYRKVFSVTQKEPAYYANYGRCLYNQGRLSDAIEAYENAVKLDSTRPGRFVSLAQIYYEHQDYQKALAYAMRALDLDPKNVEYLTLTAELAELAGDTETLKRSLKKLSNFDPYNEEVKKKLKKLAH